MAGGWSDGGGVEVVEVLSGGPAFVADGADLGFGAFDGLVVLRALAGGAVAV